jgi:hypothetical protein
MGPEQFADNSITVSISRENIALLCWMGLISLFWMIKRSADALESRAERAAVHSSITPEMARDLATLVSFKAILQSLLIITTPFAPTTFVRGLENVPLVGALLETIPPEWFLPISAAGVLLGIVFLTTKGKQSGTYPV